MQKKNNTSRNTWSFSYSYPAICGRHPARKMRLRHPTNWSVPYGVGSPKTERHDLFRSRSQMHGRVEIRGIRCGKTRVQILDRREVGIDQHRVEHCNRPYRRRRALHPTIRSKPVSAPDSTKQNPAPLGCAGFLVTGGVSPWLPLKAAATA